MRDRFGALLDSSILHTINHQSVDQFSISAYLKTPHVLVLCVHVALLCPPHEGSVLGELVRSPRFLITTTTLLRLMQVHLLCRHRGLSITTAVALQIVLLNWGIHRAPCETRQIYCVSQNRAFKLTSAIPTISKLAPAILRPPYDSAISENRNRAHSPVIRPPLTALPKLIAGLLQIHVRS